MIRLAAHATIGLFGPALPDHVSSTAVWPRGINVEEPGAGEERLFFHGALESACGQDRLHLRQRPSAAVVHLHHHLTDQRPEAVVDAADDFEFALFGVHLQQVHARQTVLADDVGDGQQGAFKRLPVQPILHQIVDILVRRFRGGPQFAAHHVRDDGANGLAVFLLVGVEAREDGGFFVERQCRGTPPVGNSGVERVKAGAVGFAVRLQRLVDDGTGLEGVN